MKALQKGDNFENFLKAVWGVRSKNAKNHLASMTWILESSISSQGASCAICGSYEDIKCTM